MAFNELEQKRIEKQVAAFIETRRPPPHIRPEVDLGFRVSGQSIEIFEVRPVWQEPEKRHELPVAKATYVKTKGHWRAFWQRADLKWHSYKPCPTVETVADFLALVGQDEYGCFFG